MALLRRTWALVGLLAFLCFDPSPAAAYEEELGAYLALGYTAADLGQLSHLPQLELGIDWGASLEWTLRGFASCAANPAATGTKPWLFGAGGEILYIVDVLRWVPFVGGGISGNVRSVEGHIKPRPAFHGVLGLDYLHDRSWAWGIHSRLFLWPDVPPRSIRMDWNAALVVRLALDN